MLLLLLFFGAPSVHARGAELVALIGRFDAIEELPNPCESEPRSVNEDGLENVCISMDALFKATYTIKQVISGNIATGTTFTFKVADHYGFPDFARFKNALLFVQLNDGDSYLEKYQGFQVHETALGSWASCGYPRGADTENGELERVTFANEIAFGSIGELNTEGVAQEFPSPVYENRNGLVRCVKGWSIERLVSYVTEGVLKARGETVSAGKSN